MQEDYVTLEHDLEDVAGAALRDLGPRAEPESDAWARLAATVEDAALETWRDGLTFDEWVSATVRHWHAAHPDRADVDPLHHRYTSAMLTRYRAALYARWLAGLGGLHLTEAQAQPYRVEVTRDARGRVTTVTFLGEPLAIRVTLPG
jgi:hypothetical protein